MPGQLRRKNHHLDLQFWLRLSLSKDQPGTGGIMDCFAFPIGIMFTAHGTGLHKDTFTYNVR